jgi:hypothetical protein
MVGSVRARKSGPVNERQTRSSLEQWFKIMSWISAGNLKNKVKGSGDDILNEMRISSWSVELRMNMHENDSFEMMLISRY